MKRIILSLLLTASLIGGASAFEGTGRSFETITFAATPASTGITAANIVSGNQLAKGAMISVETQSIRAMFTGDAATATNGHLFVAGDKFTIEGYDNLRHFRCISITDNTAVVKVTTFF